MKQSFFEACHFKAFEYVGGVPKEILYDNMKTAFVCDAEGRFYPNKRLLALANHYGFVPKRCRIRRPQTKGKVERTIGYLVENYWPRVKDLDVSVEELNETVRAWLTSVDKNILRDFGESRNERFSKEKPYLNPLPAVRFDYRHREELLVNRESCITYRTNRYSVPPEYIGQMLTLQVDPLTNEADLQKEGFTIRNIVLESAGAKKRVMLPEDEQAINQLWMKQFLKRNRNGEGNSRSRTQDQPSVEIRNPADYDQYFHTAEEETVCTR
jgi:hypothetical protein